MADIIHATAQNCGWVVPEQWAAARNHVPILEAQHLTFLMLSIVTARHLSGATFAGRLGSFCAWSAELAAPSCQGILTELLGVLAVHLL